MSLNGSVWVVLAGMLVSQDMVTWGGGNRRVWWVGKSSLNWTLWAVIWAHLSVVATELPAFTTSEHARTLWPGGSLARCRPPRTALHVHQDVTVLNVEWKSWEHTTVRMNHPGLHTHGWYPHGVQGQQIHLESGGCLGKWAGTGRDTGGPWGWTCQLFTGHWLHGPLSLRTLTELAFRVSAVFCMDVTF